MRNYPSSGIMFQPEKRVVEIFAVICLFSSPLLVGCGGNPNLAEVRGVVMLDGEPLPEAFIMFVPEDGQGASSFGKTADDGTYRMKFSDSQYGAFIGTNRVAIRTGDIMPDNSGSIPEKVPKVYNDNTTLTADVVAGKNTFDFDLNSKASKVIQVRDDFE